MTSLALPDYTAVTYIFHAEKWFASFPQTYNAEIFSFYPGCTYSNQNLNTDDVTQCMNNVYCFA